MRREHRRPRIVGNARLGGSSFVDGVLLCVVRRSALVSFWFLALLGVSWHFLKTLLLKAKHAKSIARRVRLAALWAAVRGLRGQHRRGMRV